MPLGERRGGSAFTSTTAFRPIIGGGGSIANSGVNSTASTTTTTTDGERGDDEQSEAGDGERQGEGWENDADERDGTVYESGDVARADGEHGVECQGG
jgi:hypothetical protein